MSIKQLFVETKQSDHVGSLVKNNSPKILQKLELQSKYKRTLMFKFVTAEKKEKYTLLLFFSIWNGLKMSCLLNFKNHIDNYVVFVMLCQRSLLSIDCEIGGNNQLTVYPLGQATKFSTENTRALFFLANAIRDWNGCGWKSALPLYICTAA